MVNETNKPDELLGEEDLEAYLDGNSPISNAYRTLDAAEPPHNLDHAVLEEARSAIEPPPRGWLAIDLNFWRHWARPVSTVVIMGACLTVVLQVLNTPSPNSDEFGAAKMAVAPAKREAKQQGANARSSMSADMAAESIAPAAEQIIPSPESRYSVLSETRPNDTDKELYLSEADAQPPIEEKAVFARKMAAAEQQRSAAAIAPAASALSADEYAVTTKSSDAAMAAWNAGAQPAADVWLAGIEAMQLQNPTLAANELQKANIVYPQATAVFRQRLKKTTPSSTMQMGMSDTPQAQVDTAMLANPDIWLQGIAWLEKSDRFAEAADERTKFNQVFPKPSR